MQLPNRSAQQLSWRAIPQLPPSHPPASPQPLLRQTPAAPQPSPSRSPASPQALPSRSPGVPSCSPGGPGLLLEGSTEDASPSAC